MKPLTPAMKHVLRILSRMQDPLRFYNAGQLRLINQGLWNRGLVYPNGKLTQEGRNMATQVRMEIDL